MAKDRKMQELNTKSLTFDGTNSLLILLNLLILKLIKFSQSASCDAKGLVFLRSSF